jgi:hypothetical protein
MTSAFQTVFDNASSISFDKKRNISQTVARDGTVKSISLGGQVWKIEATLPNGPKWSEYRGLIERMESLDRVTPGTVKINDSGLTWLSGYQGDMPAVNNITVTISTTTNNLLNITGGISGSTGYILKSGDFIQIGTYSVYTVVNDVPVSSRSITVHRPIREPASTSTTHILKVGQDVEWNLLCVKFPKWTISARDQISWDGPFVFTEAI